MSISPYTGEARQTFDRVHIFGSYKPNARYISPNSRIYYINEKGYMHVYDFKITKHCGRPLYIIFDMILTTDNKLKETSREYSHDKSVIRESFTRLMEEAKQNTAAA